MRGPAPWEATVLQSQVEAVVQEERKREVRPVICAKGHVFGEAVNRKRRQAGSGEEGEPGRTGDRGTGPGVGGGRLLARCRRLGLTVAFEGSVSKDSALLGAFGGDVQSRTRPHSGWGRKRLWRL